LTLHRSRYHSPAYHPIELEPTIRATVNLDLRALDVGTEDVGAGKDSPVAVGLQVAAIGVFHQYRFQVGDDHFAFRLGNGAVGRSLALGQGFSNSYGDSSGPTAWEPPLYPFRIGRVFKLFGVYSNASAWALLTINSLFNALTSIPIFFVAPRTMGEKVAIRSAWTWALLPYAMYWSIRWVFDTILGPLLLSLIFLASLELEDWSDWKRWAIYGVLWGSGALSNPSMLAFLPFSGLWISYSRYQRGLRSFTGVVLVRPSSTPA
jgi:hypothetical protein